MAPGNRTHGPTLLALLVGLAAGTAQATTQTYSGDLVQILATDTSGSTINTKPSTRQLPGDPYVYHYCCSLDSGSWGNTLWIDVGGTWTGFGSGYALSGLTGVSNVTNPISGGTEVLTKVNAGSGVTLTQRLTHLSGERLVTKEWVITNEGSTTVSNLRFYHGGDTAFGGVDSAYGFYDPAKSMVYVRNNNYTDWGLMGFYANPATPANRYVEGNWSAVADMARSRADLPNTVISAFQDAGYYLQWDHAVMAPGETWTILAYEVWTPGGSLQLVAPGSQNAAPDTSVTLPFTIQNLATTSLTVSLAAAASAGWATLVVGEATVTLGPNASQVVNVSVTVPAGATGSSSITLTASGAASASASTTLSLVNVDVDVAPASIDFGTLAPGAAASQVVTVTNQSGSSITLGSMAALAPFGKTADGCTNAVLANGASCTVTATISTLTGGSYNGSLSIPVVSPLLVTRTVSLAAVVASNFSVTASAGLNGALDATTPSPRSVASGSTVSFKFNADPGYHVATVSGCGGTPYSNAAAGVSTSTFTTSGISGPCTVSATFALNDFAVHFVTDGTVGASLSGSVNQSVAQGQDAMPVAATASSTTHFVQWTGPAGFTSTANPLTVTGVTADMSFTAHFAPGILTALGVSSSLNPSLVGENVGFTATLGTPAATGTVQFLVDGVALGDAMPVVDGAATSQVTGALDAGNHLVRAVYSGDDTFAGLTAQLAGGQQVNRHPCTVVVSSGPSPSVAGQEVLVQASVTGSNGVVPTGLVSFHADGAVLGLWMLDGDGNATLSTRMLAVGSHTLQVTYEGDTLYAPGGSLEVTQRVEQASTLTLLRSSANPLVVGQSVSFTAQVSPLAPGAGMPTGLVRFMAGAVELGQLPLAGAEATYTTTDLTVGIHTLTAVYVGDVNLLSSASAPVDQVVLERCTIGNLVTGDGLLNPDNSCQVCRPDRSNTQWTNLPAGTLCPDDGSPVTADVCNSQGACTHPVKTECTVDGSPFPAGALNPDNSCQLCDPVANDHGWTSLRPGTACRDDGLGCTLDRCDSAGTCEHPLVAGCLVDGACVAPGTRDPEQDCLACIPEQATTRYTATARGVDCAEDGLENTLDMCDGLGACLHPLRGECVIAGVTYRAGTANPDNGCQSCDPAATVSDWTHRVAAFPCTGDGLDCTADSCDGAGVCTHVLYTGCLVDNACIPAGATDPDNDCQGCFPSVDPAVYTAKSQGVACADDGQLNTADICNGASACVHPLLGQCVMGGESYRAGAANPDNPCQSCQPAASVSTWTDRVAGYPCTSDALACTADVCDGAGTCEHHLFTGCLVDATCVAAGVTDPANDCQGCYPAQATTRYTAKAQGMVCADDGHANTGDVCNGASACVHPLLGECVIEGQTYRSGDVHPWHDCMVCDPSRSVTAWTNRVAGFPCASDDLECTADVCSANGQCEHHLYTGCLVDGACIATGATDPTAECRACAPESSTSRYVAKPQGVGCGDDGQANTLDVCNTAGQCTHALMGQCTVDGAVYNAGTPNPENPCQSCDPASSSIAWTDRVQGFPCTSDGLECTADVCSGAGVCLHPLFTGCLVDGACVPEGSVAPQNECQACQAAQDPAAYSPRPRGLPCTDDAQDNTLDICNEEGACTHVLAGQCRVDGVSYNAGATDPQNPCRWCDPQSTTTAFSERVVGFPCTADGLECTADTCAVGGVCQHDLFTGCLVDGQCVGAGAPDPAAECRACIPAVSTDTYSHKARGVACADDGQANTLDQCNGEGGCVHVLSGECNIGGSPFRSGAANPENPCQSCDPVANALGWTDRVAGFPCTADGLDCTADVCNATGTCEHTLFTGCLLQGTCVTTAATDPQQECQACVPEVSTTAWTPKARGTVCADDNNPNTQDSCDGTGACTHQVAGKCVVDGVAYNAGAISPENPCRWCDPTEDTGTWANRPAGASCASDGVPCTTDACDEHGQCSHSVWQACLVDGICVSANATSPADECFECNPVHSTTSYTRKTQSLACAEECTANAECAEGYRCMASICRPLKQVGRTCAENAECVSNTCTEGLCADAATESICRCSRTGTGSTPLLAGLALLGLLGWRRRRCH